MSKSRLSILLYFVKKGAKYMYSSAQPQNKSIVLKHNTFHTVFREGKLRKNMLTYKAKYKQTVVGILFFSFF